MTSPLASHPDVRRIVELDLGIVRRTASRMSVPSPAYALGLWGEDPRWLAPTVVGVGLDATRQELLRGTPGAPNPDIIDTMWTVTEFAVEAEPDPPPETIPGFDALNDAVFTMLRAQGVVDPSELVLNEVVLALKDDPPIASRTSDFVCFVFNEDFDAGLRRNIELGATHAVFLELEAKGLLPPATVLEDADDEQWSGQRIKPSKPPSAQD